MEERVGGIGPTSDGLERRLSCCRRDEGWGGSEIRAGLWVKHLKMKRDSRCGRRKSSGGKEADFLHVGFGGMPTSSLVTCWVVLQSRPGQEEPGWQGFGWETRQLASEERVSMILNTDTHLRFCDGPSDHRVQECAFKHAANFQDLCFGHIHSH
ncbi:radical SAM domain protein [Striga asiatica]|uniref:Radical SAM domain protein n=1 Tax=Striga asiatica TaxID=4170 RepID=A0A5A7RH42_STRAF|nr:radical SAM domain protein [Striga asiatica]